jgi:nitrate/nitrite transporter NarK
MSAILRRARGVIGTSLTWATVWLVVTSPFVLLQWQRGNMDIDLPIWALGVTLFLMAAWGAACGALFALIVMLSERRRGWAGLKLGRIAAWGAAAGLAVPLSLGGGWWWLAFPVDWPSTFLGASVSATMGCALATSTVLVARRSNVSALPRGNED